MRLARARIQLVLGLLPALVSCVGPAADAVPEPGLVGSTDPAQRTLQVGFVVVDGVYNTELTAPMDMFHHTIFHATPGMRVFLVGPSYDPVTSFEGLRMLPDYDFGDAPEIDILVVPSAEHSMDSDLEDEALLRFVRERGQSALYVLSFCDGAFVLAAAGLLEDRQVTTFPSDVARLREMFPGLVVHEDLSFVADGRVLTSAGGALSFDPALWICEQLYGPEAARGIAAGLCIDWNAHSVPHLVAD